MNEALDLLARRIADRGRDALVARLRPVFADAAAEHSELGPLDDAELDRMVQAAADRAGGALWRRALADVAMDELEIELVDAADHPAVRRAQAMLGVPDYTFDVAVSPPPAPVAPVARPSAAARVAALTSTQSSAPPATSPLRPGSPPPPPASASTPTRPSPPTRTPPHAPGAPSTPGSPSISASPTTAIPPEAQAIRVAAVHVEGIETVRPGARNIELRFSELGLDVIGTFDGETIGRLTWDEITSIELPKQRRSLRRRQAGPPELLVSTDRGQARFQLPAITEEQAREQLASVFARAGGPPS